MFFSENVSIISKQIPNALSIYETDTTRLWLLQLLKKSIICRKKLTTNQYIKEHKIYYLCTWIIQNYIRDQSFYYWRSGGVRLFFSPLNKYFLSSKTGLCFFLIWFFFNFLFFIISFTKFLVEKCMIRILIFCAFNVNLLFNVKFGFRN